MQRIIFAVICLTITVRCDDCEQVKCPAAPKHYEEFGCTPVVEAGKCCPSHFDCSALETRDLKKCYYNNGTFDVGQEVHNPDIEASCTIGCFCRQFDENEAPQFECTHIDCPEFFDDSPKQPGKKCINQYTSKSCCRDGQVCGEDLTKLAKCEFNGKSYYEGERMDAGDSCSSCYCGEGFEDKPVEENKHCSKINCNIELHYYKRIVEGCVPVYWKVDTCCPIDWRCPDDKTNVVRGLSRKEEAGEAKNDSSLKCSFGNLKMSVGDFLSPANDYDQCTICSCTVPPYPHCIKTC